MTKRKGNFQLIKRWCVVLSPKFRFFSMNRKYIKMRRENYTFELRLTFGFCQFCSLKCMVYSLRWRPLNTTAKKIQLLHLCFSCSIFTLRGCVNYFHSRSLKIVFFLTLYTIARNYIFDRTSCTQLHCELSQIALNHHATTGFLCFHYFLQTSRLRFIINFKV